LYGPGPLIEASIFPSAQNWPALVATPGVNVHTYDGVIVIPTVRLVTNTPDGELVVVVVGEVVGVAGVVVVVVVVTQK
jgi:hypothetical protein